MVLLAIEDALDVAGMFPTKHEMIFDILWCKTSRRVLFRISTDSQNDNREALVGSFRVDCLSSSPTSAGDLPVIRRVPWRTKFRLASPGAVIHC